MIYYLTAARTAGAMGLFLQTWGKSLANRIQILTYEQIFSGAPIRLLRGTYIFSSLGQSLGSHDPPTRERQMVAKLRDELVQSCGAERVLNNPTSSLPRLPLLRALRERGINRSDAYAAGELPDSTRFPVFLREAYGTRQDQPPLLRNREEYRKAYATETPRNRLIAIEYCDTADAAGIYRKYGAFVIGRRIVPRHLFFSRQWLVKVANLTGPEQLAEELAYLESNPHAEQLYEICRLADIGYGRIDYAFHQDRPQIWEINTTPTIAHPPGAQDTLRHRVHERFTELFSAALDAIETGTD